MRNPQPLGSGSMPLVSSAVADRADSRMLVFMGIVGNSELGSSYLVWSLYNVGAGIADEVHHIIAGGGWALDCQCSYRISILASNPSLS